MVINEFFKVTQALLFLNSCFVDPTEEECLNLESADQLSNLNWMRSEQCWSIFGEIKKTCANEYANLDGMFEEVIT